MVRVACFDLETTDLAADRGVMLAAVIHEQGMQPEVYRQDKFNKNWDRSRYDDKALCSAVAHRLAECDVLISYNGIKFDLPFLQTRLLAHNLPVFPPRKHVDCFRLAVNKLRLSRYSLKALTDLFQLEERKTELWLTTWARAMLAGDRAAMDEIVEHCEKDVACLWEVFGRLKDYSTVLNDRGSYW